MMIAAQSNLTKSPRVAAFHVPLEARAERDDVCGSFWPSVGASGSYSRNRCGMNNFPPLPPGTPLDYNLYHAGFDATWEPDVFGGTRRTIEAASAATGAAEFGQRECWSRCWRKSNGITSGRVDINNASRSRVKISRSSAGNLEPDQQSLRDRVEQVDLEVQQATALLTATKAEVPTLCKTGFDQVQFIILPCWMGQPPGALMREMSDDKLIPLISPPAVPVGLPSDLP